MSGSTQWMGSSVPALVRGSLSVRPFGKLLLLLYRREVSGRLVVVDDTGNRTTVFLRKGIPVFVDRPTAEDRLDRVIVESGILSEEKLDPAEKARAVTGRRLGTILQELGLLDHDDVADALRTQTVRKLRRLFETSRGIFEVFVHDHPFGMAGEFEELRIEPLRVVLDIIRETFDPTRLEVELEPLRGGRMLLETNALPADDIDFLLAGEPVLEALRQGGLSLADLREAEAGATECLARILTLYYASALDLAGAGGELPPAVSVSVEATPAPSVTGAGATASTPASASSPQTESARTPPAGTEVGPPPVDTGAVTPPPFSRRMAVISDRDAVALPRSSGVFPALQDSGPVTAPRPSPADGSSRITVARPAVGGQNAVTGTSSGAGGGAGSGAPVATTSASSATSGPTPASPTPPRPAPAAGAGPAEAIRPGGDPARQKADATLAYQKGESFLKVGDFARADMQFTRAVDLAPDVPEHQALLVWTRFSNPKITDKQKAAEEGLVVLNNVLKVKPEWARGLYFAGCMFKQMGDMVRAERSFRLAVKHDERNIDAARELRLIDLRKPAAAPKAKPPVKK